MSPPGRLLLALSLAGCGYTEIRDQCPSCAVIDRDTRVRPLPAGTRTLFILVPGFLGFGSEWDEPRALLDGVPFSAMRVFDWRPSSALGRVARDLARTVDDTWASAPASLERVVIVGHSAAGLVTAHAAANMHVPAGRAVSIVNVAAPYAGLHATFMDLDPDLCEAPFALAIGGTFSGYPAPARGVRIESWLTRWPGDPVMQPRFGHRPDDPRIGPPGPRFATDASDHNLVLAEVVRAVAARYRSRNGR